MQITIGGKRWRLRFCRLPRGVHGECDSPDTPNKEIRISSKLRGEERLSTIVHEATHAAGWHIDEEFVEQHGNDVARVLSKLGYLDSITERE